MNLSKTARILLMLSASWLLAISLAVAQDELFVQPGLENRINAGERIDLIVQFEMPDLSQAHGMEWLERGRWVQARLQEAVELRQSRVQKQLKRDGIGYESLELGNMMIVESAGVVAFNHLLASVDVRAIYEHPEFTIIPPVESEGGELPGVQGGSIPVTNLEQIFATDAWNAFGVEGDGIVIGLNDSSPRYTHELMVNSYRGNTGGGTFDHNYAWYDPTNGVPAPVSDFHGTLVLSIMVGDDGSSRTGVAPGAEWMACRGCQGTGCSGVIQCLNWFIAPTDVTGNNPDPDTRPMVVNNSWGSCDTSYNGGLYEPIWDSMYAAGVIPYISNGNSSNCSYPSPPGLNTVGNPARGGRVMGIGSTTITGTLGNYATHSNWGPTDNDNPGLAGGSFDHFGYPNLKPNVAAPGQGVPGAGSGSDTATTTSTGTSFASPHVAGAAAMVMSAAPCMIGDHVRINSILMETATHVPYAGGPDNADVAPGVNHPNYATGWGEINVLAAAQAASAECGPQGTVTGQVTDLSSGLPIEGASVVIANDAPPPDSWSTLTDETGAYSLNVSAGMRDVEYSAFGYFTEVETNVDIAEDGTVVLDVALEPAPTFTVTGVVSDSSTGWALHARIDIDGFPDSPIYTDPADGSYDVTLPQGSTFEFEVSALSGGYLNETRSVTNVVVAGVGQTENFALDADLLACSAPGYVDQAPVAYYEDFEFSNGGFSEVVLEGSAMWEHGAPDTWPGSCADGSSCWGTNLDGLYPSNSEATVTSPVIDLTSVSAPLTLVWQQANHIESFTFDKGYVEMSVGGGPWQILWQNPGATVQTGWRELSQDISDAAGQTMELRWRLDTDGSVQHNGLYFDLVRVQSAPECVPRTGELVSGRVTDANTGEPLIGAEIADNGTVVATTGVSEDPALGEGAYLAFVQAGSRTLSASLGNYQPGELTDVFVDGNSRLVDFALAAGRLSSAPEELNRTLDFGETDDQFLVLLNDGTAPVDFELTILNLLREDFENTFPPAGWEVENLGGTCVWARNDEVNRVNFAGGDGFSAAADSDDCGQGTTMDTALISPPFVPGSDSSLDFVVSYRHLGSSRLDVDISTNGGADWTTIQSYNASESAQGPGTPVSLPLAAYAGQEILARFRYVAPGWDWWAQVDQIEVVAPVDWLTVTPGTGTFGVSTLPLEVTYDAGAASITGPGVYQANILVENDTPYGTLNIPVTMTVEPGTSFGGINGIIQSAGYCGANPFDAAGAEITVTGDSGAVFSTIADGNGFYELFIPIGESPVDIVASAPNHLDGVEIGIALVAGSSIPVNFTLDLDEPCIDVSPSEFSSSLLPNQSDTQTLSLGNVQGAGSLSWTLETVTPPASAASAGFAPAASGAVPANAASDLLSVTGGDVPRVIAMPAGTFDCDGAPGLVIHDDGSIENGYSGNPTAATDVSVVEGFAIDNPANLGTVCIALLSQGPETRDFELIVYDDDGAGGTPGTQIAAVPSTATGLPNGIPDPIVWYTVDLGPQNISLDAGTVFIGARWVVSDPNVFLASDESGAGGLGLGYFTVDSGEWDQLGVDAFPNYSALFVRPQLADPFGCSSPDSVSWLSVSQGSGTTAAGDSSDVDVIIDSTGLIPGAYEATICVTSNDPTSPLVAVPVSLEVGAAAGTGILQGTMQSLGYCSENPTPAAGASIEVVGQASTYNLTTDGNGDYSIVLDMAESPVTVNATAPNHQPQSLVDIDLVEQDAVDASMGLVLEAACASATPTSLGMLIDVDTVDGEAMTLINDGAAAFTWNIQFDEAAANGVFGTVDVVEDGGFELGIPNSAWDEASTAFGTPICDTGCGLGGGTGPNTGSWWTWFGGTPAGDTASVSQDVTIPTGSAAELRFFLEIPASGQPGFMEVSLGGNLLFSVTEADAGSYPSYQEVVVDVSAYADGGTYQLIFASETTSAATLTNFFVDDVALLVQPGPLVCADPQGVSWVSVDQASGSVDAESSEDVIVIYDTTGLAIGQYQASLCLATSDSENELIIVPISLEVAVDDLFEDRFEEGVLSGGDRDGDVNRKVPE